ncbi:MAG: homoserine kinase [Mariprofundaceae bacterium]|nr:homoserine kinase [Mariprofundaceae bacterium]
MSVYTEINQLEMQGILKQYNLGSLKSFQGISAGIENSNFFVDTDQGRFVLTIFERMQEDELPYFMNLMQHLSAQGIPCPKVQIQVSGGMIFDFLDKKGCIISCLEGQTLESLNQQQLESAGRMLAALHNAGSNFKEDHVNPTGLIWMQETTQQVLPLLNERYGQSTVDLLQEELAMQQNLDVSDVPAGLIHADYFVDNILVSANEVSGVIDFYYACDDLYVYDLAIAANALALQCAEDDAQRLKSFVDAYQNVRVLSNKEKGLLAMMLRRAALRFWVSRLYDAFFPREGAMIHIKDPEEYREKLLLLRQQDLSC